MGATKAAMQAQEEQEEWVRLHATEMLRLLKDAVSPHAEAQDNCRYCMMEMRELIARIERRRP